MYYLISIIKDGEVLSTETSDEHPSEDYLRELADREEGDFCDVCRLEENDIL